MTVLSGRIVDRHGNRMTPTHAVKSGKRYRYHATTALMKDTCEMAPRGERVPAGDLEVLVLDRLRTFFGSSRELAEALAVRQLDATLFCVAIPATPGLC